MPRKIGSGLSMREREMLDILHRLRKATAAEVQEALADPPSYSAVRSILRIMEQKGHVAHCEEGKRYVYTAVEPRQSAARAAIQQVVRNFFGGSLEHELSLSVWLRKSSWQQKKKRECAHHDQINCR